MKRRNCAKQREDARDLEAYSHPTGTYGNLILMITDQGRDFARRYIIPSSPLVSVKKNTFLFSFIFLPSSLLILLEKRIMTVPRNRICRGNAVNSKYTVYTARVRELIFKERSSCGEHCPFIPSWNCKTFLINVRVIRQSSGRSANVYPRKKKKRDTSVSEQFADAERGASGSIGSRRYAVDSSYYSP